MVPLTFHKSKLHISYLNLLPNSVLIVQNKAAHFLSDMWMCFKMATFLWALSADGSYIHCVNFTSQVPQKRPEVF